MAIKILAACAALALTLIFGFQQLRSNREINERVRRGRVPVAVEDAKIRNLKEVQLRAPIGYYAAVKNADEA